MPKTRTARSAAKAGCCPAPRRGQEADIAGFLELCKALGDETRLAILAQLAACEGAQCACDIEGCFELSQPTISHHLKVLRKAGLVRGERRGTWIYYAIEKGALARLKELVAHLGG